MSVRYSMVTKGADGKGKYIKLSSSGIKEIDGWYVGGTLRTGQRYATRTLTIHVMRPNGDIIGVNTTPGFTKQFLDGRTDLGDPDGSFIKLSLGAVIQTQRGPFTPLEVHRVKNVTHKRPEISFKLGIVDMDDVKAVESARQKPTVVKGSDVYSGQSVSQDDLDSGSFEDASYEAPVVPAGVDLDPDSLFS